MCLLCGCTLYSGISVGDQKAAVNNQPKPLCCDWPHVQQANFGIVMFRRPTNMRNTPRNGHWWHHPYPWTPEFVSAPSMLITDSAKGWVVIPTDDHNSEPAPLEPWKCGFWAARAIPFFFHSKLFCTFFFFFYFCCFWHFWMLTPSCGWCKVWHNAAKHFSFLLIVSFNTTKEYRCNALQCKWQQQS